MEIRSMTGFGNAEAENDNLSVKAEIKSVNNKFLELNIRLPRSFKDKETELRQALSLRISRGTVQINVMVEKKSAGADISMMQVNIPLAQSYKEKLDEISNALGLKSDNHLERILSFPEVLKQGEESGDEKEWGFIMEVIEKAYLNYDAFRIAEGNKLSKYLADCTNEVEQGLAVVAIEEPKRKEQLRNRIFTALKETVNEQKIDTNRFEQEMIYYLEKFDIGEEKHRLENHIEFFRTALSNEPNGKKLNFISQEMGREINTIGSKANHFPIQQAVVGMKESLEKIKEQLLNVI